MRISTPPALLALLLITSSLTAAEKAADADGWQALFDGKSLDGWVQRGGKAKYAVEDGQIIGSSAPSTPNSFLCTQREFTNFVLELEFKVQTGLNSGVQVRGLYAEKPGETMWKGRKVKLPAGRVYGVQVEIDPSARAWTGGLYGEGGGGWFNDLKANEPARKAFKAGEWNKFHIECRGESVKTWLNDVPAAEVKDDLTLSGFIGLQVHGVGARKESMEVRFRNIRLKEL
jgi:hypothetical protein